MKILCLSLLRLGDLFHHMVLIREIKKKNPDCELHIMTTDSVTGLEELFPEVAKFHHFPRQLVSRILVERTAAPQKAAQILRRFLDTVNSESFARVYNFTHTRLGSQILDQVRSHEKFGTSFKNLNQQKKVCPATALLEDKGLDNSGRRHLWNFLLAEQAGIDIEMMAKSHSADRMMGLLQIKSADRRKEWSPHKWKELWIKLRATYPNLQWKVLAAQNEIAELSQYFAAEDLLEADLRQVNQKLTEARILVTVDSAIQHLAVLNHVPVVSLFLGPANPSAIVPFQKDAIIIEPKVSCWPCQHSGGCTQASQVCSEDLEVDQVFVRIKGELNEFESNGCQDGYNGYPNRDATRVSAGIE